MSPSPLPDSLTRHAAALADTVAVVDDRPDGTPVRWTFAELNAQSNRLANALRALGVRRGDKVVWCGQNSPGVVCIIHACRKLGAVAVPPNHRLVPDEAQYVVDDSDAVLACVDAEQAPLFAIDAEDWLRLIARHRVTTTFGARPRRCGGSAACPPRRGHATTSRA